MPSRRRRLFPLRDAATHEAQQTDDAATDEVLLGVLLTVVVLAATVAFILFVGEAARLLMDWSFAPREWS